MDGIRARPFQTLQMKTTAEYVAQGFFESFAKFSIKIGVNDWIHS
jgi:hypothetical protein